MPRGVKKSNLDTLKQHGEKILAALQVEINRKEKELAGLKAEPDPGALPFPSLAAQMGGVVV